MSTINTYKTKIDILSLKIVNQTYQETEGSDYVGYVGQAINNAVQIKGQGKSFLVKDNLILLIFYCYQDHLLYVISYTFNI